MRLARWLAIAGLGIAGLVSVATMARAGEEQGSESRGTGMGGTSTGARPGEVTGAPGAPGGTSGKEQRAETSAEGNEVSGKVETYDRANRTLSLANSDKTLKVTDDTVVFKDGDRVSPGQLMEGDQVRASYTGSGETLEVVRIDVTAAPAKKQ